MNTIDLALDTDDLSAAHLFYVRQLGLPVLSRSQTHLSLLVGNTHLTLRNGRGFVAPKHIRITVVHDLLVVLMRKYELGCQLMQPLAEQTTYRAERKLSSYHFYDPMGNLIEFIPQLRLTSGRLIVSSYGVRPSEEHSFS